MVYLNIHNQNWNMQGKNARVQIRQIALKQAHIYHCQNAIVPVQKDKHLINVVSSHTKNHQEIAIFIKELPAIELQLQTPHMMYTSQSQTSFLF